MAAPIAIGSAGLLVLRWYGVSDLAALPSWVFGIVWIAFVYASVVLLIRIIQSVDAWIKRALKKRHRCQWINKNLDTLSEEERDVFAYMLKNNQRSVTGPFGNSHFAPLVQKGLLICASGAYRQSGWPHTVPDDVWEELIVRRNEFLPR